MTKARTIILSNYFPRKFLERTTLKNQGSSRFYFDCRVGRKSISVYLSFGLDDNDTSNRRLEALSVACDMAARWKKSPLDDIEREEAIATKTRLDTSRRDLAVQISLAKLRPGAVPHVMELKSLWNEPEKLLCRLYHSMAHIAKKCGDLHRVVDEIANLYDKRVVDASKIRKFVVRHWLQRGGVVPLLRSKEEHREEEEREQDEEEVDEGRSDRR